MSGGEGAETSPRRYGDEAPRIEFSIGTKNTSGSRVCGSAAEARTDPDPAAREGAFLAPTDPRRGAEVVCHGGFRGGAARECYQTWCACEP